MKKNIFHKLTKPINFILPKKKAVYAVPLTNCRKDKYDLLNYGSDNLLCVIRNLYENYYDYDFVIYLECFSEKRMPIIQEYLNNNKKGNLTIKLVKSHITEENSSFSWKQAIKNTLLRFTCKIWLADTGHVNFFEKVKKQSFYVMNYCTPFKKEEGIDINHNFLNIDGYIHTSELCAHYLSAEYLANYYNSVILGFARNDTLFHSDKTNNVKNWIKKNTGIEDCKIIIYAPTYREYEGAFNGGIFGFDDPNCLVEDFLEKHNCVLIVKMHPKQIKSNLNFNNRIIAYNICYDFSLYDVMACSDLLITDYSSLMHDYVITGKKVVLDWFDHELYETNRGFCFEPVEYYCPGPIAKNLNDLLILLEKNLNSIDSLDHYNKVNHLFNKYLDDNSTERICKYLITKFKENKII